MDCRSRAFSATASLTVLFETNFGHVWQLRLGLIAVALVLAVSRLAPNDAPRHRLIVVLGFLSVVLLVSLAWISHAAAARMQPLGLLGDALHLCAAGAWIGGLAPLAIFLTHARGSLSLGECAGLVLKRFSTLSLSCVSVLVMGGVSNSWLLVGSIHALFATRYGSLLLLKLTLFGILVGFGARNRFVIKTKLLNASPSSDMLAQLRRNVICEACVGLAVVIIVACLGVTPPARHASSELNKALAAVGRGVAQRSAAAIDDARVDERGRLRANIDLLYCIYVQCWHKAEGENSALWRIYAHRGVALESTISELTAQSFWRQASLRGKDIVYADTWAQARERKSALIRCAGSPKSLLLRFRQNGRSRRSIPFAGGMMFDTSRSRFENCLGIASTPDAQSCGLSDLVGMPGCKVCSRVLTPIHKEKLAES
ncbi:MAG: hypothetical protein DME33_14325 [Verrucomicrobia bacterium]|nr:MAG: hypothetical protein DME33_14325 [Verrucomicrobiota bacterium]